MAPGEGRGYGARLAVLLLQGTEELSIELPCTLPFERARALITAPSLEPELEGDRATASLLLFRMKALHPRGLGLPGPGYAEALWRLGVRWRGEAAWLAVACDLDRGLVGWLGARLIRYPVRRATINFRDEGEGRCKAAVRAGGARLDLEVTAQGQPPDPVRPRPMLVLDGARLLGVPWGEHPAPYRRQASIVVTGRSLLDATLGEGAQPAGEGLLHRGREHLCGVASPC